MPRCSLMIAGLSLLLQPLFAFAAEQVSLQDVLRKAILEPEQPLSEVQVFTESRVPPMPVVRTVEDWERQADRMRQDTLDRVVFRGEARAWRSAETRVEWLETLSGGPGYRIRKLRYEALPGLWVPALLYEPDELQGQVPVVLNVNGHDRGHGKAAPYKQIRCINQARRGMLALNVEWVGMGQLATDDFSHYRMNQLNLCGTSGLAPFYLSMSRGLDLLLSHEHADPKRVAVAGLSGGGWQTIFISSLDTRVTLCDPVAGYSSFRTRARHLSDLGDSEQTPADLATVTDYAQLTAMLAPRPTLLTFNAWDNCCFRADHALPPLLEAARPIFKLYGKSENLRAHVNYDPGDHNFDRDNREALYRMLGDHFFAGDETFNPQEIGCDGEVKSKEELAVDLPADNADFHSLAMELARDLPADADVPTEQPQLENWQGQRRELLKEIVHAHQDDVQSELVDERPLKNGTAAFWRLKVGSAWTVPAVELVRGTPRGTVILVVDEGRGSAAGQAEKWLAEGYRVLAVDPFYLGESKISQRDFLFALLVSAVGERPLGVQAGQLAALARWSRQHFGPEAVQVVAVGPRTSLIALVAAGLEPKAIAGVELHKSLGSLREVIERNMAVTEAPELFCFGLLQRFDLPQLAALVAPRPVRFVAASDRLKRELSGLKGPTRQAIEWD